MSDREAEGVRNTQPATVTTKELRRPQFFACPANYTRDHLVELQVAKAYLLEDTQNSLSCKTINWLNTRGNVCCAPRELNALKGEWFREVLSFKNQGCDPQLHYVVSLLCWYGGGNMTCEKNRACEGITIGQQDCCCHISSAHIEEETSKSIFWRALLHEEKFEPEVRNDLLELERLLSYKARVFCGDVTTTTAASTTVPVATSGAHFGVFNPGPGVSKKGGNKATKKGIKASGRSQSGARGHPPRSGFAKGGSGHASFGRR